MNTRAGRRGASGFTLIEMIVAITLLAIIAVISWRALDGVTRSRAALTEEMENTRALNQLFDQLSDDGDQIVGDRDLHAPAFSFGPGQLRIVRAVRSDGRPMRWQVVEYRIVQGVILRQASPPVDARDAIAPLLARPLSGAGLPIARGVADLRVRAWVRGRGWITDMRDARQVMPILTVPTDMDAGTTGIRGFEVIVRPGIGVGTYVRLIPLQP